MNAPATPVKAGKILLVGLGPGSHDHLTDRARAAIAQAQTIVVPGWRGIDAPVPQPRDDTVPGQPVAHHQAQPVFIPGRPRRQPRIERLADGRLRPGVGDVEHDLRILLQGKKKRPVVQLQR